MTVKCIYCQVIERTLNLSIAETERVTANAHAYVRECVSVCWRNISVIVLSLTLQLIHLLPYSILLLTYIVLTSQFSTSCKNCNFLSLLSSE